MSRTMTTRGLFATALAIAAFAVPSGAQAAIPQAFTESATPVDCDVLTGDDEGIRFCSHTAFEPPQARSTVASFDGTPIDVNVAFPPEPDSGPDGDYPLVLVNHGYAGSKLGLSSMRRWINQGFAVLAITTRGFGESCGSQASRTAAGAACDNGYVHLMDTRYEVRDAQELIGLLVDEGLADPERIGSTGGSYGGGMTMALAALRNRTMLPDGSLVPWTSPEGTPISLAAGAAEIPWTDLANSLVPNGGLLDYIADAPYFGAVKRVGVPKLGWISTLYAGGLGSGFYAPPGSDPDADLTTWRELLVLGNQAIDGNPDAEEIVDEVATHHSSYGIDDSVDPAPLMISSGWTDDLFPANEAVRFYNRTRLRHPDTPMSLNLADFGHPRGQNKAATLAPIQAAENDWFAHYVLGDDPAPPEQVQALTQTCPSSAAPEGPYVADNYRDLAPGEVRFRSEPVQPIATDGTEHGNVFGATPVFGGGFAAACATSSADDTEETANYRFTVPVGGLTLMGSPTVIANFALAGQDSQVAARLFDVGPDDQQTLVARGLWRPRITGKKSVRQVFQLNPNGYRFASGHSIKLELAPHDHPYGRRLEQGAASVSDLELRLPVHEQPGSRGDLVRGPAFPFIPWLPGIRLAPDYDNGAPQTAITRGPSRTIRRHSATFNWQWSDAGSNLECSLDGSAFQLCDGPLTLKRLKAGRHTFRVRAVDPDGNADPTPATRRFRVRG